MAFSHGTPNSIVTDGLVFCIDPANTSSYPRTGTTVTDIIGNTTGTLTGANGDNNTPQWENTNSGVFDFDGTDDHITISGLNDITVNTVSAWFKASFVSNKIMMEKGTNAKMMFQPNSQKGIWYANAKFYNPYTGYADDVMDGTWKNWVQIEDTDFSYFYINGVLQNSQSNTSNSTNSNPIVIMARSGGSFAQLGNIGPVQIYNRALSASEVLQNYNALKNRFRT